MTGPSAAELLDLWETTLRLDPARRAIALVGCAARDSPGPAALSIGERDRALFGLRESLFGRRVEAVARCSACGEDAELTFPATDVAPRAPAAADSTLELCDAGWTVVFRPPSSADLLTCSGHDVAAVRQQLLERCVLAVREHDRPASLDDVPATLLNRVPALMAEADPGCDVELAVPCPHCGSDYSVLFDVGEFLWQELDGWCYRLLHDVQLLAGAYGWRESDVLALSAWRRQLYVEALEE